MPRCHAVYAVCASIWSLGFAADEDWHVQSWRVAEGLPDNGVKAITQTSDGMLWIATAGGVVAFDGLAFAPLPPAVAQQLAAARVERIAGGKNGELWLATRLGGLFQWADGRLSSLDGSRERSMDMLDALCVDAAAGVWVARRGLIEHYLAGRKTVTRIPSQRTPEPIVYLTLNQSGTRLWAACGARSGWCGPGDPSLRVGVRGVVPVALAAVDGSRFWAERAGTFELFDGDTGEATPLASMPEPVGSLTGAINDGRGGLWLGFASKGLFHWNGRAFSRTAAVPGGVRTLYRDRDGAVWVGTDGLGMHCIRPRQVIRYSMPAQDGPQQALSVAETPAERLCVVAPGRRLYLSQDGSSQLVQMAQTSKNHEARSSFPAADGALWIATLGGGVFKYVKDAQSWEPMSAGLASMRVRCLFRDPQGRAWAGLDDGVAWWNGRQWESTLQAQQTQVLCFANDRRGQLWVGTMSGKVLCLSGMPPHVVREVSGLPGSMVHALTVTRDDVLWMGLEGAGLCRLDPATGRMGYIKLEHGLPGASVLGLVEVPGGFLALGTQRGICLARLSDLAACAEGWTSRVNAVVVGSGEGLADVACSVGGQPVASTRRSGRVVFATGSGAIEFDPMEAVKASTPCRLSATELQVDGRSSPALSGSMESISGSSAVLHVSAPSFNAPRLLRLRYRVEGVNADWQHSSGTRALAIGAPSPGRYQVRVQACNNALDWDEPGLAVTWIVHPRLWQTVWFQMAAVLAVGLAAFLLWRRRMHLRIRARVAELEREQALTQERARIARDMHDAVGARLTQISLFHDMALAEPDVPHAVREKVVRASAGTQEVVMAMDEIVWSINPRNDTLAELASYLAHTTREYLEPLAIACRLDIRDELPHRPVHAQVRHTLLLMVKECLQNVVKHSRAQKVTLQIEIDDAQVRIRVQDNGIGMPGHAPGEAGCDGLRNLHDRACALGSTFALRNHVAGGTEATITVPIHRLS